MRFFLFAQFHAKCLRWNESVPGVCVLRVSEKHGMQHSTQPMYIVQRTQSKNKVHTQKVVNSRRLVFAKTLVSRSTKSYFNSVCNRFERRTNERTNERLRQIGLFNKIPSMFVLVILLQFKVLSMASNTSNNQHSLSVLSNDTLPSASHVVWYTRNRAPWLLKPWTA